MRIVDLSQTIEPHMTVFPGTDAPQAAPIRLLHEHGYNERRLTLTTHTGTHMDAPAHLLEGAPTLDRLDPGRFLGRGMILDATSTGPEIGLETLLARQAEIMASDYLLLRTGWDAKWKTSAYLEGFPVLSAEAARWLARQNMKGVGVDAISVDVVDSEQLPVHHALLGSGMVIVENLKALAALPENGFTFCCLPLPLADADGSPARAVAILDG